MKQEFKSEVQSSNFAGPSFAKPKIARLNKYVIIVAFLWFAASLALLLFAGSNSAHAAQPKTRPEIQPRPAHQMTMLQPADISPLD